MKLDSLLTTSPPQRQSSSRSKQSRDRSDESTTTCYRGPGVAEPDGEPVEG